MRSTRLWLGLLFLAQFCLFWQYGWREVLWAYPGGYDQTAYLTTDAVLYQNVLHDGPYAAFANYLGVSRPTGFMLPWQWNVLHLFAGPGRMSNLSLAFGYFVLLQTVCWLTCRHLTGRVVFGWIGVGLLLAQQSAFAYAGGMYDCRIDFIVYNLYGIFVCLLVRSDGLRCGRWVVAAGGCALLLITFRFIAFAYLLGFCVTLLTLLGGLRLVRRGARREEVATLRLAMWRAAALGAAILGGGGLFVAGNWRAIHDYYVVGHLTGKEKGLRAVEMGVRGLSGHLTYYLDSLVRDHLGGLFVAAALLVLGLGAVARITARRAPGPGARDAVLRGRWLVGLLVIGASLFAPWFILTLDESKSPVVGNVFAPSAALLVVVLAAGWNRRPPATPLVGWGWRAVTAIVLAVGCGHWLDRLTRQGPNSVRRAGLEQINALYDTLAVETGRLGLSAPRIATDMMFDWNTPQTINVAVWERTGRWLAARTGFGYASLEPVTREQVFAALAEADATIISTLPKAGPFPLTASIRPLEKDIASWCEAHLLPIRVFELDGGTATLYLRPNLRYDGLSGGWITPEGFRLHLPGTLLERIRVDGRRFLVLEGPHNPNWLKGTPLARASLEGAAGGGMVPASFTLPRAGAYQIRLDLGGLPAVATPGAEITVDVHLDGATFYPPDVGINDARHLVVMQPATIRLE